MENKRETIFVDGYTTKDIPNTAPDYILGKGSFHVERLMAFLNNNKEYAVNGYLNFETLRSKEKGTRYSKIDFFSFDNKPTTTLKPEDVALIQAARERENASIGLEIANDPVLNGDIPF